MKLLSMLSYSASIYVLFFVREMSLQCSNDVDQGVNKIEKTESDVQDPAILKVAEQQMLKFMGLKSKPDKKLKMKVKVPSEMWKLYYKWSNENYQSPLKNDVDTVRVLEEHGEVEPDHELRRIAEASLRFNTSELPRPERLHKAELHLFTEKYRSSFPLKGSKNIKIYTNLNNGTGKVIGIKKIPRNLIGYVKVDITDALNAWMNDSMQNSTFQVVARQSTNERLSHIHIRKPRSLSHSTWRQKKPLLIVYTSSKRTGSSKRTRRSANVDNSHHMKRNLKNDGEIKRIRRSNDINIERIKELKATHKKAQKETCRLRPYFLDFVKLGWDAWIIAPVGYKLNYCIGECPRPLGRYYNTTNHAVIQNSVLRLNRNQVPPLCCIPTDLRDQTFLYMDNSGKILMKQPSEMIATGCGCH